MKKIITLSVLTCLLGIAHCNGQVETFLMKDNSPYMEHIDTTLIIKKDKIHQFAKQWIAKTFNSSKTVIDLDDPSSGTLIVKYMFDTKVVSDKILLTMSYKVVMQIDSRDNKIRVRTTDYQQKFGSANITQLPYEYFKDYIQRLLDRGETMESISKMDIYREFLLAIKGQTYSLIKYIKDSAKDDF